jgi:hypothetical protein
VTAVVCVDDMVIAAFSNGVFNVYRVCQQGTSTELLARVQAHAGERIHMH